MEAILLALLASYGLPALVFGAAVIGAWQFITKFYLPDRNKRIEREEQREKQYLSIVEKNTTAFNELSGQLRNLDGAVTGLRASIADLGHEFRGSRETQERLEQDVDALKGDIKELKGYLTGSSRYNR